MDLLQAVVLALLQGLTEFLPISSSAHLILVPYLFNWPDQGLAFDVAVHVGTLAAVIWYFRVELKQLFISWLRSVFMNHMDEHARLAWGIIIATLPLGVAGFFAAEFVEAHLRSPLVIAVATIVFALLLLAADFFGGGGRSEKDVTWKQALVVGVFQAVALIHGTSRSGIAITGGLFIGLSREASARFAFLLSVPAIAMAGLYEARKLLMAPEAVDWAALSLGTVVAGITAYTCIYFFLAWVARIGMLPFVAYRIVLGAVLLIMFL